MIVSDFAIKRPTITVAVMLALVAFGLYALAKLEIDEFPDIRNPIVAVLVPYPGAAPAQVETEIANPLEEAFESIPGVDETRATLVDGFAQIIVQFVFAKDPDQAAQDVRDAIARIRGDLPPEMEEPIVRKFDPDQLPIVSLVLASDSLSPAALTRIADPGVTRELRSVEGVAQVRLVGGIERELTINLHPGAVRAAGVSIEGIVQAVQAQNVSAPVGRLNAHLHETPIRLRGRLEDPAAFRNMVVRTEGEQIVRLGQVATVEDSAEEVRSLASYNGQLAVALDILKTDRSSTTTVADRIKARLPSIRSKLPDGVSLNVVRDAGERVRNSVRNVQEALIEGTLLTVGVVFLFLNSWRSTVITGVTLPISMLSSFVAVWAFGFTLNTMTLLGLTLAIGILIDDAIVVRENIVRHVEAGASHSTAAHAGTNEIGLAVTATTFSIVAVFVPIAFMGGIAGQWFKPFALTIACAVLVSLFVSFSLDPMLSAYWHDPALSSGRVRRGLAAVLARFNRAFDRLAERYKGVIGWALDHRAAVLALTVASLAGAVVLQATLGGASFAPTSDNSEINLRIQTPPGSDVHYTWTKAEEVAALARSRPQVFYTYVSVGSGSDEGGNVDEATIYIRLKPRSEREMSQQDLQQDLRSAAEALTGFDLYVDEQGPGGGGRQIQVQVRGEQRLPLERVARTIATQMRSVEGAVDVGLSTRGDKQELAVRLDRTFAATLGLSAADVAQALRLAFAGIDAGDWIDPEGETREVRVRLAPAARSKPDDLKRLPLPLPTPSQSVAEAAPSEVQGRPQTIPLGLVADVRQSIGPAQIEHLDGDPVITIGANVQGRDLGAVTADIQSRLADFALPLGVRITQGGEVESQAEVFASIFAALILALLLMYLVLVMLFESFLDPFAILLSLPLALIGVVVALIITGDTLNIMSLIGIMLLMGIVAKNAILLIDFTRTNVARGMPLREALIEAGALRLRPILMTSSALVAGMVPVALGIGEGADFRAPLGRAVIGGTIASTLLTLLVIPTVYEILHNAQARLIARLRRRSAPIKPS